MVIPRIYGASELGVRAITSPGGAQPRVEYVGGDVFVGLDCVDSRATVTQDEAEGWQHPFRDAVVSAIGSTTSLPAAVLGTITITDEALATAALVDVTRLAEVPLEGAPGVFVLARDRVVLVGADDEAGIARVLTLAEELYEGGGPLVSAHPLVLVDGAWMPFPWRERLPALDMGFERILRLFTVRAYEAQGRALVRPDVRYADPKIQVLDSGVTTTFATWLKGTATLLPVVDNVIIADAGADGTQLSVTTFGEFLDAAGDAVIRTGLSPLRYFVPGAPPR